MAVLVISRDYANEVEGGSQDVPSQGPNPDLSIWRRGTNHKPLRAPSLEDYNADFLLISKNV